jgi:solute carrier family 25 carnitine/acylcarnitine transporter 20/29
LQAIKDLVQPGATSTQLHPGTELLAGGTAGVLAWASIYPTEVIKCRVQAGQGSGREVANALLQQKGWSGFFVGMRPVLMRAFVTNAAIFYGYAVASRAIERAASC